MLATDIFDKQNVEPAVSVWLRSVVYEVLLQRFENFAERDLAGTGGRGERAGTQ